MADGRRRGSRRRTADETKAEAERLIAEEGFSREAAARELGVGDGHLKNLKVRQRATTPLAEAPLSPEEVARLAEWESSSGAGVPPPLAPEETPAAPPAIGGFATQAAAESAARVPPFASTEITPLRIIHDAAMCAVLGRVMEVVAPDGTMRQGRTHERKPPGPVVGRLVFTGGTALSTCHRLTERFSEDLDFVFVPHPDFKVTRSAKQRAQRIPLYAARDALDGVITDHGNADLKHSIMMGKMDYGNDQRLAVDVAWRDDFIDRADLLEISVQPATSLLERFADASHLPVGARGPHLVPCVGVPYIAATKLDAQHLRAEQGDYVGMAARARDLYDLASIARSEHADQVREMVPALAEIIKGDVRNRGSFPRPANGYANSPAFRPDSEGVEVRREGYRRIESMVYGEQITFDEALDLARSLDPR